MQLETTIVRGQFSSSENLYRDFHDNSGPDKVTKIRGPQPSSGSCGTGLADVDIVGSSKRMNDQIAFERGARRRRYSKPDQSIGYDQRTTPSALSWAVMIRPG